MNVLTKSFGLDLLKTSLVGGVCGLGYSAYYQCDKKITVPFFIISLVFFRTIHQFTEVEMNLPSTEGAQTNFRDIIGKEITQTQAAFRNILAQTICVAITLIAGRKLGILGSKATTLISIAAVCTFAVSGFGTLGTWFLGIGVKGL